MVIIFGAITCLKSRSKWQVGKKIIDFRNKAHNKEEKYKQRQKLTSFVGQRAAVCLLHLEENKMTVLFLLGMARELNAAYDQMSD